ncbi:hypothetical protein BJX66DRAFT_343486 [Aspergillus keveii]|uniref:SGNH hydrolase-type esterase domain-containing protein n=1 Tax=Aspergillus keveii TaxID=714993 RepID=A0ABR4FP09_9EURO
MPDADNEGHLGSFLSEIKEYALLSVAARLNVILFHAGTNDVDLQRDIANAPGILEGIMDVLLKKCPDVVVLIAKIISSTDAGMHSRSDVYNAAIEELVARRQAQGGHVQVIDIGAILTAADLADKRHPNDNGWGGWHDEGYCGRLIDSRDSKDGYLVVSSNSAVRVYHNNSNVPSSGQERYWIKFGGIAPGVGKDGSKARFGDINGDGLANNLVLYDEGSVGAGRNNGTILSSSSRKWEEEGTIATGVGE